jgi:hypothetical protein
MNSKTFSKTLVATLAAAAGFAGVIPAANAQVVVRVAPPAPVYEVQPAARPGYVWAAGHHEWRGNRYVWVPGHWVAARHGFNYEQARGIQRPDGRWVYAAASWQPGGRGHGDRDRDGVANRYDQDRDGDGVANRHDRHPNNPRRS